MPDLAPQDGETPAASTPPSISTSPALERCAVVAVYDTHVDVAEAIDTLRTFDVDVKQLSVIAIWNDAKPDTARNVST